MADEHGQKSEADDVCAEGAAEPLRLVAIVICCCVVVLFTYIYIYI